MKKLLKQAKKRGVKMSNVKLDPEILLYNYCKLTAFEHDGFWQPMDTLREKSQLEELWQSGKVPWKVWA